MSEVNVTVGVTENTIDVTHGQSTVVVNQVENTINVSAPGPQGPQGPQGEPGQAAAAYTHSQPTAASSWVITHNLNKRPSVTVVDSAGTMIIGELLYNSVNQITVSFSVPFSGFAYLN